MTDNGGRRWTMFGQLLGSAPVHPPIRPWPQQWFSRSDAWHPQPGSATPCHSQIWCLPNLHAIANQQQAPSLSIRCSQLLDSTSCSRRVALYSFFVSVNLLALVYSIPLPILVVGVFSTLCVGSVGLIGW